MEYYHYWVWADFLTSGLCKARTPSQSLIPWSSRTTVPSESLAGSRSTGRRRYRTRTTPTSPRRCTCCTVSRNSNRSNSKCTTLTRPVPVSLTTTSWDLLLAPWGRSSLVERLGGFHLAASYVNTAQKFIWIQTFLAVVCLLFWSSVVRLVCFVQLRTIYF